MDVDQAAHAGDSSADASGESTFSERLRTPLWWYPVAVFAASLLAAEFRIAGYHLTVWIPFGTLLPLAAFIVWVMGRMQVSVRGATLYAGDRELDLHAVTGVISLDEATTHRVLGREGDPASVTVTRAWIGPSVQLWLDHEEGGSPADDTSDSAHERDYDGPPVPYWLVSTRRPEQLVAAIRARIR